MKNMQLIRRSAALFAVVVAGVEAAPLHAADAGRTISSLDNDWRFNKGDAPGAEAAAFNDGAWTKVNVPHDWPI